MTRRDGPPASPSGSSSSGSSGAGSSGPSSSGEVEYVRRLSLAILSTLQSKGLLGADEVDAILIAARRTAQLAGAAGQGQTRLAATPQNTPAGTRPAPSMQVTVQPPGSLTWHTTPPGEKQAAPEEEAGEGKVEAKASAEVAPPTAQGGEAASGSAASQPAAPSAAPAEGKGEQESQQSTPDGSRRDGPERDPSQEKVDSPEQRPQPPMFDIKLD